MDSHVAELSPHERVVVGGCSPDRLELEEIAECDHEDPAEHG